MDRGVPIGIGAKKLREFDQLVWVQRGVKKKVDFFKRGLLVGALEAENRAKSGESTLY